jgi:CheY-like chemotaxis protein
MQRTDGTLVCAELRQHGCKLPIIAMTGTATAHSRMLRITQLQDVVSRAGTSTARDTQQFIGFGFDTVLPKPFDIQAMGRAITGACVRRNRINAGTAAEIV